MATGTYEDICTFCCEIRGGTQSNLYYDLGLATRRDDYILAETEHFAVIPCIGALTDWYVLVVSKRHVLSVGWLDRAERTELRRLLADLTEDLRRLTGHQTIVFEHGSYDFRDKGGACYDHAHIHIIATDRAPDEFVQRLPDSIQMLPCDNWIEYAHETVTQRRQSYLALSSGNSDMIAEATGAPSQFFRRCLAAWMNAEDGEWDWLVYPQPERVTDMMRQPLLAASRAGTIVRRA